MKELIIITDGTLGQLLQSKLLKDNNPSLLKEPALLVIGQINKENIIGLLNTLLKANLNKDEYILDLDLDIFNQLNKNQFTYSDKVDYNGPEQNQLKSEIR